MWPLRLPIAPWFVLALALCAAQAWAQAPAITLSASRVMPGTEVTLEARGLEPDGSLTLELRRPDGSTRVEELDRSGDGTLRASFTPDREGMWIVRLRGDDVHSIFGLAVVPDPVVARDTEPGVEDGAPGDGEDGAQVGAAEDEPADAAADDQPVNGAAGGEPAEGASANGPSDSAAEDRPADGAAGDEQEDGAAEDDSLVGADAAGAPDAFRVDDGNVIALRGEDPVWELTFPEGSGPTGPLLMDAGALWVPHGLSLLEVDPATGAVRRRIAVPAPVVELRRSDEDGVVATVEFEGPGEDGTLEADVRMPSGGAGNGVEPAGSARAGELGVDGVGTAVRFGSRADAFGWLRREAEVDDPAARLEIDPTNPWLYLAVANARGELAEQRGGPAAAQAPADDADGAAAAGDSVRAGEGQAPDADGDGGEGVGATAEADAADGEDSPDAPDARDATREELYEEAVARASTFFDLAGIGAALHAAGREDLARRALDEAFRDFAERGYDPDLLTSTELRSAYRFPLVHLEEAVAAGDVEAAGFWAPWAHRVAGGNVAATRAALRDYARLLRDAGDREGASLWSARAGELLRGRVGAVVDRAFIGLASAGWLAVLALLLAATLLYLTLAAKYWRPQSLHMRLRRASGRRMRPWARGVSIRFFSFMEKLVLVLLLAATLAMAGLAAWNTTAALPAVTGSGTLASVPAMEFVAGLDGDATRAAFVRGFAAQLAGDTDAAETAYEEAGAFAPAVNNLGALRGDERLYQRALELAPGLPAARYNLGRTTSPAPFHEAYRTGRPLLVTPSPADLKIATAGGWRTALTGAFAQPWGALRATTPGMPVWLWTIVLVAFFLLAVAVVVALLIPRPRVARNAPRTIPYHLLALLVPGTGLTDELWGVLLLVPWAVLGLDAVVQWNGGGPVLGFDLPTTLIALGVIYAVNIVALVVEFLSYQGRMRTLKKDDPELARRFGMRV